MNTEIKNWVITIITDEGDDFIIKHLGTIEDVNYFIEAFKHETDAGDNNYIAYRVQTLEAWYDSLINVIDYVPTACRIKYETVKGG